jgi:hypothetical protein
MTRDQASGTSSPVVNEQLFNGIVIQSPVRVILECIC